MKHTKGPWEIIEKKVYRPWKSEIEIRGQDNIFIADIGIGYVEAKANARLIAAAPDLLEACEFAYQNLSPKGNIRKDYDGHLAIATLTRAIQKAKGE